MMTFAMCACRRSLSKLGVPSIEPDHRNHPDCPECGEPRRIYTLTQLVEAVMALGSKRYARTLAEKFGEDGAVPL